jgi:hypothetical protein
MAICIAYLGVGAVAIPTGIISAGFVEQYQRKSSISDIKNADIKEIADISTEFLRYICLHYLVSIFHAIFFHNILIAL